MIQSSPQPDAPLIGLTSRDMANLMPVAIRSRLTVLDWARAALRQGRKAEALILYQKAHELASHTEGAFSWAATAVSLECIRECGVAL